MHDAIVNRITGIWDRQYNELTSVQKNKIGLAYLRYVVGLSDTEISLFIDNDYRTDEKVGKIMGGLDKPKGDYSTFWQEVSKQAPDYYTQGDLEFLASEGAGPDMASWMMICHIDDILKSTSPVIRRLHVCAHVHK